MKYILFILLFTLSLSLIHHGMLGMKVASYYSDLQVLLGCLIGGCTAIYVIMDSFTEERL